MNFKLYWPELDKPRIKAMISNYRNNCKKDAPLSSISLTDGIVLPNIKIRDLPTMGGGYQIRKDGVLKRHALDSKIGTDLRVTKNQEKK